MNTEKHLNLSDLKFINAFKSFDLEPQDFTHIAHLRLAYLYIQNYGVESAVLQIEKDLHRFVLNAGSEDKFHSTVTRAATYGISHFIQKSKYKTFKEFINEFPELQSNFIQLINSHYSFDILQSTMAKGSYIAPDLQPFY